MENEEFTSLRSDNFNPDEANISRILGSLKRVEAPADFDFRVRSSIAVRRETEVRRFRFPAAVKFALPLALILLVGGYVVSTMYYRNSPVEPVPVTASAPVTTLPQPPSATNGEIPSPSANISGDRAEIYVPKGIESHKGPTKISDDSVKPKRAVRSSTGGSIDSASQEGRRIFPEGLDPQARQPARPKDFENGGQITAKDVLAQMGADINISNGELIIGSVKVHSPAEKAGLKSGDIIESINDRPVNEKTSFGGQFSGKNLRVKRGENRLRIDLQHK